MTDGKGYLIPDDVQPMEMGCILVFYPEDAQNYYLRALVGSLSYLGTWVAWERDTEKRGILAAKAWKEANDCTFDSMSCVTDLVTALTGINQTLAAIQAAIEGQEMVLDASGLLPALAGIEDAIENISISGGQSEEDMATVINNYGCGCGCGNTDDNWDDAAPIPDDPDIPPTTEPINPSDYQKCSLAHYLIYTLRLSLLRSIGYTGDWVQFSDDYYALFTFAPSILTTSITYSFVTWLMQQFRRADQTRFIAQFDPAIDQMVCALYSATSPAMAKDSINSVINQMIPDYADVVLRMAAYLPYHILFLDSGDLEIPTGFENRSCCGSSPVQTLPIPPLPVSQDYTYVYVPMQSITVTAAAPDDEYNNVRSTINLPNGIIASVDLRRSTTFPNGASTISTQTKTLGVVREQYPGAVFVGLAIGHRTVTSSPLPLNTGNSVSNNYLPYSDPFSPGIYLYLVAQSQANEIANNPPANTTVLRRMSSDVFSDDTSKGIGNFKYATPTEAAIRQYNAEIGMDYVLSIWRYQNQ